MTGPRLGCAYLHFVGFFFSGRKRRSSDIECQIIKTTHVDDLVDYVDLDESNSVSQAVGNDSLQLKHKKFKKTSNHCSLVLDRNTATLTLGAVKLQVKKSENISKSGPSRCMEGSMSLESSKSWEHSKTSLESSKAKEPRTSKETSKSWEPSKSYWESCKAKEPSKSWESSKAKEPSKSWESSKSWEPSKYWESSKNWEPRKSWERKLSTSRDPNTSWESSPKYLLALQAQCDNFLKALSDINEKL
jgi:hypothetical protein